MKQPFIKLRDRLSETNLWFPFPALVAFGLALVLGGHLLLQLNPRLGNHADTLIFPSKSQPDGAIWLAIAPIDDDIVVTTADRGVYRWSQRAPTVDEAFRKYINNQVAHELVAIGMALDQRFITTSAVLAADQRLTYAHLRPIIQALADAGITNYAFETRLMNVATSGHAPSDVHAPAHGNEHGDHGHGHL